MTQGRHYFWKTMAAGLLLLAGFMLVPLAADAGDVPVPQPAKAAKGENCVAPIPEMRRNHMNLLKHQRDDTLRKGIRGNPYSLRQCVECHAVPDKAAGGARTVRPFCQTCHSYAAVNIDCFSCHTGRPGEDKSALIGVDNPHQVTARMQDYLKQRSVVK